MSDSLAIAMIHEGFQDPGGPERLGRRLAEAREDYPGCLDVRAGLYARAWSAIAQS